MDGRQRPHAEELLRSPLSSRLRVSGTRSSLRSQESDPLFSTRGVALTRPLPCAPIANGRNPWQRFWLVPAVSALSRFATGCHRLQPRGSIRAPLLVVCQGNRARVCGADPWLAPFSFREVVTRGPPSLCHRRELVASADHGDEPLPVRRAA